MKGDGGACAKAHVLQVPVESLNDLAAGQCASPTVQ